MTLEGLVGMEGSADTISSRGVVVDSQAVVSISNFDNLIILVSVTGLRSLGLHWCDTTWFLRLHVPRYLVCMMLTPTGCDKTRQTHFFGFPST